MCVPCMVNWPVEFMVSWVSDLEVHSGAWLSFKLAVVCCQLGHCLIIGKRADTIE